MAFSSSLPHFMQSMQRFSPEYREQKTEAQQESDWAQERRSMERKLFAHQEKASQLAQEKAEREASQAKRREKYLARIERMDRIADVVDTYQATGDERHVQELVKELANDQDSKMIKVLGGLMQNDRGAADAFDEHYESISRRAGIKVKEPNWIKAEEIETGNVVFADENSRHFAKHYKPADDQPKYDFVAAELRDGTAARVKANDPRITRLLTNDEKNAIAKGGGYESFGTPEYLAAVRGETGSAKKPTDKERESAGFYARMVEAEKDLTHLGEVAPNFDPSSHLEAARAVTNTTASTEMQLYKQAALNWVRANLRKESGAVISDEEAKEEYKNYFSVVGDSKVVIEQKAATRRRVQEAMKIAAGVAEIPEMINDERPNFNKWAQQKQGNQHEGFRIVSK